MNDLEMKHLFEAAILAAGRPITTQQLAELYDERERPSLEQVLNALNELRQDYENRGIELLEVSSGWRVQVRNNCVDFVSRMWQERPSRYSRAMLETLALIAYRQPITRGEIEEIRGVAVSTTIMRTMYERNWIRVVGHREVPGRPEVLATTKEFLDYFGLKSLDQLPTLADLKDLETIGVQLELNTGEAANADGAAADGDALGQIDLETMIAAAGEAASQPAEATAAETVSADAAAASEHIAEESAAAEGAEAGTDEAAGAVEQHDTEVTPDELTAVGEATDTSAVAEFDSADAGADAQVSESTEAVADEVATESDESADTTEAESDHADASAEPEPTAQAQ